MANWLRGSVAASVIALGGVAWAEGDKGYKDERAEQQQEQQQDQQDQQATEQLTGQQVGQQYGGSGEAGAQQQQQQETAELKGTVVKYGNKLAHLKLEQGAVVPVKITSQTKFEGLEQQQQQGTGGSGQQQQQWQKQQQKQALQQLAPGDQLTATVMNQKGENVAQKIKFDESKSKEQQLDGKIARASGTMVDVEYNGAIVPLKVDKDTQFTGVKSARELKEGDQIRASFKLENGTTNVATKVEAEKQQGQQQQNQQQPQQY